MIQNVGCLRGFIADYGVPLMVLIWTALSYIPVNNVPLGIPRRLFSPNPWSQGAYSNWTVIKVRHILLISKFLKAKPCTYISPVRCLDNYSSDISRKC